MLESEKRYQIAKERYAKIGVDTDKALKELDKIHISLHCWQGDDIQGFVNDAALSGGIQVTGNYLAKPEPSRNFKRTLKSSSH